MRLPKLAIDNYRIVIIIILLLVTAGIMSYRTMPRSEDPAVTVPGASVVVIFPGANPLDIEELVISVLEEAINEIDDIKKIEAYCEENIGSVHVEFVSGSDADEKYSEVMQKVNSVANNLPEEIVSLTINQCTINDTNFLQLAITSETAPYRDMEKEAEKLKTTMERIDGIRKVEILAAPEQEIKISLNLEKLAGLKIPVNQIIALIQSTGMNIPGGNLNIGAKRYSVKTSGSYESLSDIENTVIHSSGTKIVLLKDVADVTLGYKEQNYFARFNGERAVFITANQKENTNIFHIMNDLNRKISEFEKKIPSDMKLYCVFDQSEGINKRLDICFSNLIQGIVLVGLFILLAVGIRASLIVMLVIPISILISIGFLDVSGYGLQQISIAGLVITLGLLVDNAIVVTENISRFLKKGEKPIEAAINGTDQIGWAIVSATATTLLAFIPLLLMRDASGDFIRSLPLVVIYTLTVSLFLALTFTPFLSSKLLKPKKDHLIQGIFNRFIDTTYRNALDYSLTHPKTITILALVVFTGSIAIFPLVGISFFPKAEKPLFIINVETPKGTNIHKTDEVVRFVESVLQEREEITNYASNTGHSNPKIYYNMFGGEQRTTHAQLIAFLRNDEYGIMGEVIEELRTTFSTYPGAKIEIKELEQGRPVAAPIEIILFGDNTTILNRIAGDIERLFINTPGLINIDNTMKTQKTDLQVSINKEKAGMLGIPLADIDRSVRLVIAGLPVSQYRDAEGKEYDITIHSPEENAGIEIFEKVFISSVSGTHIPLSQVAAVEFLASPVQINHYNLERSATILADVAPGYSVHRITNTILSKLENYDWPPGYRYYAGGEKEGREETFGGMERAILYAIIAIFAVLVFQFKSFSQPLIVFAALPLATIGSILALFVTGNTFSFTAFIGLTSLVGIVVNNSIILVDYTNQLRNRGETTLSALKIAGETRFTPIILTTLTTIGGLLPLTLMGGSLWAPMGWTIIGGLVTSTMLTLIVVPVLYRILNQVENNVK